jgi:hypothetical protein
LEPNRLIDRQRLDVALAETARAATDPATRAQIAAFESLLRTRYRGSRQLAFDSVRREIDDFVMPHIGNSAIFTSARYVEILGDVIERILPSMGESDEISGIAVGVIEEEIERHREVQDRIYQALGA